MDCWHQYSCVQVFDVAVRGLHSFFLSPWPALRLVLGLYSSDLVRLRAQIAFFVCHCSLPRRIRLLEQIKKDVGRVRLLSLPTAVAVLPPGSDLAWLRASPGKMPNCVEAISLRRVFCVVIAGSVVGLGRGLLGRDRGSELRFLIRGSARPLFFGE